MGGGDHGEEHGGGRGCGGGGAGTLHQQKGAKGSKGHS